MKSGTMMCAVALSAMLTSSAALAQAPEARVETQEPADTGRGFVGKLRDFADDTQIIGRLNGEVDGWYPRLGGMTTGSGFSFGPGYRTKLAGQRIHADVSAGFSMKGYKAVDVQVEWLQRRFEKAELWTNFRFQDFPQEDFYGIDGLVPATRTNYSLSSTDWFGLGIYHLRPWLRVGGEFGHFSPSIGAGTDEQFPSTDTVFSDLQAPGLATQPDFLHTTLFTEIDYRDERGNPRSGGYYRAAFGIWDDRDLEQFDFRRFDAEVAQFIPILTRRHVIASRIGLAYVNNSTGERVPFYVLPYVGGSRTLRGYEEFRFVNENALWWNTEYRWNAIRYLDLVLFYDVGKVSPNWADIGISDARTSWGFGLRVASTSRVFARLDVGLGGEERQMIFKLGPSF